MLSNSRWSTSQKPAHSTCGWPFKPPRCRPPMPPTPIWKRRSLLFWLTWARAAQENEATPVVTMAPVLRKLRRLTGEPERDVDFVFMVNHTDNAGSARHHKQKSVRFPALTLQRLKRATAAECPQNQNNECPGSLAPFVVLMKTKA